MQHESAHALLRQENFCWSVIRDYTRHHGFARFQREGYEQFMGELLPDIIGENSVIRVRNLKRREEHTVTFEGCTIFPPVHTEQDGQVAPILRNTARTRKLTYSNVVTTNLTYTVCKYAPVMGVASAHKMITNRIVVVHGTWHADTRTIHGDSLSIGVHPPIDLENGAAVIILGKLVDMTFVTVIEAEIQTSARGRLLRDDMPESSRVSRVVNHLVEVPLCEIPCMVGTKFETKTTHYSECAFDHGGYFIVNGIQKVLLAQQKLRVNKPFIFKGRPAGKYSFINEVRSCHDTKWRSTSTLRVAITKSRPASIVVMLPFLTRGSTALACPLGAILVLLGFNGADMERVLCPDPSMDARIRSILEYQMQHHMATTMNGDEIMAWLGKEGTKERSDARRHAYCSHILANEFLPHLGMGLDARVVELKALYLGMMCRDLVMTHLGEMAPCDRDDMTNRRLDGPGPLLAILFRQLYRNLLKTFRSKLTKTVAQAKCVSVEQLVNNRKMTSGIQFHFSTGNWSLTKGVNTGVVQVLSNMSSSSKRSHLRRCSTPINRDGKNIKARMLHPSTYGLLCPSESPEGASCGLINNLTILTHVSIEYKSAYLHRLLYDMGVDPCLSKCGIGRFHTVLVNGVIIGVVCPTTSPSLATRVRGLRRTGDIHFETSVVQESQRVIIALDPGRCMRPLFIVSALSRLATVARRVTELGLNLFEELIHNGIVEYLDKQEETSVACVATRASQFLEQPDNYTHIEIHPSAMFGSTVAQIVFPGHNQAPRNIYQASMGKQAITVPHMAYRHRLSSTHTYVLCNPQKALVRTRYARLPGVSELDSGISAIVAIACYNGYNQEDSIIASRAAVERGLGQITYYKVFRDTIAMRGTEKEVFEYPPENALGRRAALCYNKLDASGVVREGVYVEAFDVIIGKCVEVLSHRIRHASISIGWGYIASPFYTQVPDYDETGQAVVRKRCRSTALKINERGFVDKVLRVKSKDGQDTIIVRIRQVRQPIVGDKFSSRHGQKVWSTILARRSWGPGCVGGCRTAQSRPTRPVTGHDRAYMRRPRDAVLSHWYDPGLHHQPAGTVL